MKMNRLQFVSLLALVLSLAVLPLRAQVSAGGNEAFGALRVDRDPVRMGMAGAGSSLTTQNQAFASFGNPAAAAFSSSKVEAGLSYASWSPHYAGAGNIASGVTGHVTENVALSVGFARQGYPGLDFETASAFKPSDMLLRVGAGIAFSESFALGVTAGYAKEALMSDYSLSAFSVTAMAQYRVAGLNVAAGVEHLGGKVGEGYPLPSSLKLAADYGLDFENLGLRIAFDGDYYFSGNYSVAAGLDLGIGGAGFLRGGYRFASAGAAIPSCLGLGGGARFAGFELDFAFLMVSESLSGSWMAGVSYRF